MKCDECMWSYNGLLLAEALLVSADPGLYSFINQGALTVDGIDDVEEMKMCDVRWNKPSTSPSIPKFSYAAQLRTQFFCSCESLSYDSVQTPSTLGRLICRAELIHFLSGLWSWFHKIESIWARSILSHLEINNMPIVELTYSLSELHRISKILTIFLTIFLLNKFVHHLWLIYSLSVTTLNEFHSPKKYPTLLYFSTVLQTIIKFLPNPDKCLTPTSTFFSITVSNKSDRWYHSEQVNHITNFCPVHFEIFPISFSFIFHCCTLLLTLTHWESRSVFP